MPQQQSPPHADGLGMQQLHDADLQAARSITELGWEILLELVQHMEPVDRSSWRLVDKAACQAVYEGARRMFRTTPYAPISALPALLHAKCSGLKQLSCSKLRCLYSIHGIPAGLEVLDISWTRVFDLSPLRQCTALQQLSAAALSSKALLQLPSVLQHLPSVQRLSLGHSVHGDTKLVQALALAMQQLTALEQLDLGDCYLGAAGVKALAPALSQLTGLQQLGLGNNALGAWGAQALAPALQQLTGLQQLDLRTNDVGAEGVQALVPALQQLTGLQQLDLKINGMGAEGAQALAPALQRLTGLQQLGLGNNALGAEGIQALVPVLHRLTGLQQLHLDHNDIGDQGAMALTPALLQLTGLRQLYLDFNGLGVKGKQALLPVMTRSPHVDVLV